MPDLTSFGDVIFADDRCAVLLHPDSSVAGHAMVVWKRHVENLSDLDAAELVHFTTTHTRAERALLNETGRERAILMKLGIQTPHLHLHIYPVAAGATRDDVMRAIDGTGREERPREFVERLRRALTAASA
ncbi:MAG TPA: HIT family protein [Thermoanaerobaculia bacterium]